MKSIKDIELNQKRVLLRLNLNVPIKNGVIKDDYRIKTILPTIQEVAKHAKKTIIIAHLGRPKNASDTQFSLQPISEKLSQELGQPIIFLNDCIGEGVKTAIDEAEDGSIFLLENLRFHKEEQENDEGFGKQLAELADVYINDAFGDSAKATASIMIPPKYVPSAIGLRFQKEIENLDRLRNNQESPFVLIVGGAKIKEKLGVLESLGSQADVILLGGGVANTVLKAQGINVQASLVHDDELDVAQSVLDQYNEKLMLPIDVLVAKKGKDGFDTSTLNTRMVDALEPDEVILDMGPETIKQFTQEIQQAKTVFWAGPLGYIEWKPTEVASLAIATSMAEHQGYDAVGGGETAKVIYMAKVPDKIEFISTGGSASLTYLSKGDLPGIQALQ